MGGCCWKRLWWPRCGLGRRPAGLRGRGGWWAFYFSCFFFFLLVRSCSWSGPSGRGWFTGVLQGAVGVIGGWWLRWWRRWCRCRRCRCPAKNKQNGRRSRGGQTVYISLSRGGSVEREERKGASVYWRAGAAGFRTSGENGATALAVQTCNRDSRRR